MDIDLDVKDKKLLYRLSLGSREPLSQLAKETGISKTSAYYRIQRLQNKGVITKFAAVVNIAAIRASTFAMLIKFNVDIYKNPEIIDYFKQHEFANWSMTLSGNWDIFVEFIYTGLYQVEDIVHQIIECFNDSINTYQVYSSNDSIKVESLIPDFYKDLKLPYPQPPIRDMMPCDLDKTDKLILNLLNIDSSLSYKEISERLGLTLDVVRYRIKNLIKNNVILKFFPEVSLQKLGYTEYLCIIKLRNLSKEEATKIENEIKYNPNVEWGCLDILSLNLIFVVAFKKADDIDELSRGLRNRFANSIEDQNYLIIKDQLLFNLYPKGLV